MSNKLLGKLSLAWALLILITFSVLTLLGIPVGNFLDWLIGGVTFWWLVIIVTIPWNIYFRAQEVMTDAQTSQEKGIALDTQKVYYVKKIATRSFWVALGLHFLSAIVLYGLAAFGVTVIGYLGSIAALLLTFLRPAIRSYDYIRSRLFSIKREFSYPRDDVIELRDRLNQLSQTIQTLQQQLNTDDPNSWAAKQEKQLQATANQVTQLHSELETLRYQNQSEHERLSLEAQNAIAQLSEDSRFLGNVREIIRFIKES